MQQPFPDEVTAAFADLLDCGRLRVKSWSWDPARGGEAVLQSATFEVQLTRDRDDVASIRARHAPWGGDDWRPLLRVLRALRVEDGEHEAPTTPREAARLIQRQWQALEAALSEQGFETTRLAVMALDDARMAELRRFTEESPRRQRRRH